MSASPDTPEPGGPEPEAPAPGLSRAPTPPRTLLIALLGLGIEAVEMAAFAVALIVAASGGSSGELGGIIALAVMFLIIAAGLVGLAVGTWRVRRWARPASVSWQILLVLSTLSGVWGNVWVVVAVIVPAVLVLAGTFLPPSLRYYDARLSAADAAHRQEMAARDSAHRAATAEAGAQSSAGDQPAGEQPRDGEQSQLRQGPPDGEEPQNGEAATGLTGRFAAARRARSQHRRDS